MPAGVDDDGLRWSTPYSEIIGTALGSIIAAIMTPHAARNVTPSATPVPTIGICAWNSSPTHAAADSANSAAPERMAARSRTRSVRALLMAGCTISRSCRLADSIACSYMLTVNPHRVWSLQRVEVDAHPLCCLDELV